MTMLASTNGYVPSRTLKFQVGFLLAESKGQHSDNNLDFPRVQISEDMVVDYLRGTIRLSRTGEGILVQGTLTVAIPGECNRCLQETAVILSVNLEELFVHPPRTGEEFIVPETGVLDLAPLLRQEIFLTMPINILCQADCKGLCPECGQNWNEGICDCADKAVDPRLAALKALRDQVGD
ncbi:MAG TPA: DUF177 domain-containing protein [Aggregatilineales bacterium]|nr:DUF177 domain-containing protein [Anaerolineales bacterium]HRE47055.1 DUF177 domain-containing protein [Aggregatilineales bacterium]